MIIAGTGHRPNKLGGYDPITTRNVIALAQDYLIDHPPEYVISGMAQGWDMAIAQAAVNLSIPFVAYIPFVGQEQMWPASTRLYYAALLSRATRIKICSEGGYAPAKMHVRNHMMVNDCDHLVALWDGSEGGTGNCIAYATFQNKPYTNLWNKYLTRNYI